MNNDMTSEWLAAVLPANQKPKSLLINMGFNMDFVSSSRPRYTIIKIHRKFF